MSAIMSPEYNQGPEQAVAVNEKPENANNHRIYQQQADVKSEGRAHQGSRPTYMSPKCIPIMRGFS